MKTTNSEVDAYSYIKEQLGALGWVVKNPARFDHGEVYKQNECLSNLELKKALIRDMPEAIVKINPNTFWVIESKREKTEKALNDALTDLKDQYAPKINSHEGIKCEIVSAIAGNDSDGYLISNQYLHKEEWMPILKNGYEKTSLLSREEIGNILHKKNPNVDDQIEFSEEKYLLAAEHINNVLHLSAINKSKRARFVAGVVLSFASDSEPNLDSPSTSIVVESINSLIKSVLKSKSKLDFYDFIALQLPPNEDNHIKYREAILQVHKELKSLDIRSAMNSGNDVLGKFYEVFLKYGNGAKEIGIVLTPRHITQFASKVLDVKHSDIVFDPTCGTGGFLVAAFDHVKNNSTEKQLDFFKKESIFGIEQEDDVVALSLVNMIFRGDGRNNIREGNCFNTGLRKKIKDGRITAEYLSIKDQKKTDEPPVTKVMMNPPFALKKGDEKEYHFINYALKQMEDSGLLFAITPISVFAEGGTKSWRKNELLKNNTLLAVVTFPEDLFYPVGVNTLGVFIKKGIPHKSDSKVFFARAATDGFLKKKGKRLFKKDSSNILFDIQDELKAFISNPDGKYKDVPEIKKICALDTHDKNTELVAEAYIDNRIVTKEELEIGIEKMVRETTSFLIENDLDINEYEN